MEQKQSKGQEEDSHLNGSAVQYAGLTRSDTRKLILKEVIAYQLCDEPLCLWKSRKGCDWRIRVLEPTFLFSLLLNAYVSVFRNARVLPKMNVQTRASICILFLVENGVLLSFHRRKSPFRKHCKNDRLLFLRDGIWTSIFLYVVTEFLTSLDLLCSSIIWI